MLKRCIYSIGFLSLSLLIGCTPTVQQHHDILPAAEVLQKAALKSAELVSARYDAEGSFSLLHKDAQTTKGTFSLEGLLQDFGEKIALTVGVNALQGTADLQASIDLVVTGPDDIFLRANSWTGLMAQTLFREDLLKKFIGIWWVLPRDDSAVSPVQLTPDPRILQAQAEVVRITEERGFASIRGSECYRYDVEIDHEKLIAYLTELAESRGEDVNTGTTEEDLAGIDAKGQIWIDAESFLIRKLQWTVTVPMKTGAQSLFTSVTVDIFDHNNAPDVVPPADAKPFIPMQLLNTPLPTAEIVPLDPSVFEEDLLQQLFDEGAANPYSNQISP
ncbi:MAG: hypothetical protein O2904_00090 [bacterium]|nr:hypothetical protein [bacterium]